MDSPPAAAASSSSAAAPAPRARHRITTTLISPFALVVLSMDDSKTRSLKDALNRMDLADDSKVLSASSGKDREELLTLLNRRPIGSSTRDPDGDWEARPDDSQSMACLLIAHHNATTHPVLAPLGRKIIRWVKHGGGIVLVHGPNALVVLSSWFEQTVWRRSRTPEGGKCALTPEERAPPVQRSDVLPVSALPDNIDDSDGPRLYLAGVEDGEHMYASIEPYPVYPVALSWFGSARGCVGFLAGVDKTMLNIAAHIANRAWMPAADWVHVDEKKEQEVAVAAADEGASHASAAASKYTLIVLSFDDEEAATLSRELFDLDLENHSTLMNLRQKEDSDKLRSLLNRPPLTVPEDAPPPNDDDEDDGAAAPSPSMAGLLIVNYSKSRKLNELQGRIVKWVQQGGILIAHVIGATKLLRGWFNKRWSDAVKCLEAVLNYPLLSPKRSVPLMPTTRDPPLPKFLGPVRHCLADVGRGDSVYVVSPGPLEVCSIALSEIGPSRGCVGFIGGVNTTTLQVVVQLVNRQWTPASRGSAAAAASAPAAVAPSSPAAAASSSSAAAGASSSAAAAAGTPSSPNVKPVGRVTVDKYIELAGQFPQPKRNHLLSLVPAEVPAGWKHRDEKYGCVHSCCARRNITSLGSLRSHTMKDAQHKLCDASCAIWQNVQMDRPAVSAAASAPAGPPLSLPMPVLEGSSSSSAAAAASAVPSTPVLASQSIVPMDLSTLPVAAASSMALVPLAADGTPRRRLRRRSWLFLSLRA